MSENLSEAFDSPARQREAAELGMWVFLATEVLLFGALFIAFAASYFLHHGAFREAGSKMEVLFGSVNTVILLTSSLMMALAVRAAERGKKRALMGFLLATMAFGLVFLGVKGLEYRADFLHHIFPGHFEIAGPRAGEQRLFFHFYYIMTGLHAVHVTVGVCVIGWVAVLAARGRFSRAYFTPVENVGLYWHLVDIVWIFLYPVLYLTGMRV